VNIVPVHAGNPGPMTGAGNWTYLVPGSAPTLVDAGVGRAEHLDAVFAHAPLGPAQVLVTHIHPDHAAGAPALAGRAPATRFVKYPWPEHDAGVPVPWHFVRDGDVIATGEGGLQAVHTPGHSPDHLAFVHPESGTAFTGDLLVLDGTVVIPASHGGVLADYLRSLARLAALGITRALPAHGPPIDDPLALIAQYVVHRRRRESQVLEALSAGAGLVADIAARIYRGLDPALVPQARESVRAHLVKLEADGVAERADPDGVWRLRG
jgi:glyoxylase-like metal-dependent hydrolase (beta-lactamase superfamily II)